MGLFGMGRRPRQPGEPPPWFSPFEARRMTDADWLDWYAMLTGYLIDWAYPGQLGGYERMRQAVLEGQLGGPNDAPSGRPGAAA